MNQFRCVAIVMLGVCATARATEGQQGSGRAPRDSAVALPRVTVEPPREMRSPDRSANAAQQVPTAVHVDSLFHGHGFDGTGGIHFGTPAVASFALGTKYWLGDAVPGAVFATVEPGLLALRYGVGYQIYDERALGMGVALRLAQLRGWREALGMSRGVQYTGGDATLSWVYMLSTRVGLFQGQAADGNTVFLGTFDLGIGF